VSTAAGVHWERLEHAFGRASDLPELLDAVSHASGHKLQKRMRDLCERVLHQGTIYSASPPAVHELIAMLARSNTRDKAVFYDVLGEFASSARQAIRDGRAIPCCSGGEPANGAAILSEILQAHDRFAPDLEHPEPAIRGFAASLLTASVDAEPAATQLVRDRYSVERDPSARLSLLSGLIRVRARFPDWREFLAAALGRESDPANRCALRRAEVHEWQSDAPAAAVDELVATSIQTRGSGLFEALRELGDERELAALLQTLKAGTDRDFLRTVAEHLLRRIFHDERTGWEDVSYSLVDSENAQTRNGDWAGAMFKAVFKMLLLLLLGKMFPFLLRRKLRKVAEASGKRARKVEYWGLEGAAPEIPAKLTANQQTVLNALAEKSELWFNPTNLWALFGLPDAPETLREFVTARS
jgi:hypothetical protein